MKLKGLKGTISVIFGYKFTDNLLLVQSLPTLIDRREFKKTSYPKRLVNKKYDHKIKYYK